MKPFVIAGSIILVLVGLLSWLTPLPGGTVLIALGLVMLVCTSDTAVQLIKRGRTDFHFLNKSVSWIESLVPQKMAAVLRRTRPTNRETAP